MGFFDSLKRTVSNVSSAAQRDFERKSDNYHTGYARGSQRASSMSDSELRSSIQRARDNGISDWKKAGETRAMVDEYKERNSK